MAPLFLGNISKIDCDSFLFLLLFYFVFYSFLFCYLYVHFLFYKIHILSFICALLMIIDVLCHIKPIIEIDFISIYIVVYMIIN